MEPRRPMACVACPPCFALACAPPLSLAEHFSSSAPRSALVVRVKGRQGGRRPRPRPLKRLRPPPKLCKGQLGRPRESDSVEESIPYAQRYPPHRTHPARRRPSSRLQSARRGGLLVMSSTAAKSQPASGTLHDLSELRARRLGREPMYTKRQLAEHYSYSTRWVELRVQEGMPSHQVGGQRRFLLSETDAWFDDEARGQ